MEAEDKRMRPRYAIRPFLLSLSLVLAGFFLASLISFGQDLETKAMTAFKSGNYDEAIADYNQAIQGDPQDAVAYFKRAFVYMTKGDDDQATADLTQAIQLNPAFAEAYFRRAFVYMTKGNNNDAIDDLTRAC